MTICTEFPIAYPHARARVVAVQLARLMGSDAFERRDAVATLDFLQIRGGLERDTDSWTGYDYRQQCWIVATRCTADAVAA